MRNLVRVGVFENIQEFTIELLRMQGKIEIEEIVGNDARKYLMKDVLAMGNIDTEFFSNIITRARSIIYIGNDQEIMNIIRNYAEEKDIPSQVNNENLSSSIQAWYKPSKSLEIYSSAIYSEMELANKYMMNTGPKFSLLVRYISQIELVRNTAIFDQEDYSKIRPMYDKFLKHHETIKAESKKYDEEYLLEIYEELRP